MAEPPKRRAENPDMGPSGKKQHQQVKIEDCSATLPSGEDSPELLDATADEFAGNSNLSLNDSGGLSTPGANGKGKAGANAGHRPVTSCTHCRQHKIKCNASEKFPAPCSRCQRMGLHCEIDPQFRPKKGSQLQSLRNDVDELKVKIEYLTRNESLIAKALRQSNMGQHLLQAIKSVDFSYRVAGPTQGQVAKNKVSVQTYLTNEPQLLQDSQTTTNPTTSSNSKVVTPSGSEQSPGS